MHFDGPFKTVKEVDENGQEILVSTPPQYALIFIPEFIPID